MARLTAEAEIEAEKLVSILRMFVSAGLLLFFAVAVGPFSGLADELQSRQWIFATGTMAIYFLVGFTSWRLCRAGFLKPWMIWVAVTADCALLLANVWLSLQNTGLPGASLFILPSVWLVPIALAFGMLRLNPAVQVYSTLWMVLGLALLLSFDVNFGVATDLDTDLVAFFLADPPNVMRLTMIAFAGAVLVVAARRTRDLMLRSISETRARANLTRYLPARLAGQLARGQLDELRRGRREDMAILFVDMRGFTAMSEGMTPEDVSALISEFRTRLSRVVDQTGGMIDKFMGDAAMIVFSADGDPRAAAANALLCAEGIRDDMARWSALRRSKGQDAIRVGVGGHWGAVFSGVVGDGERLEYSVFGDAVNVAARLEAMTKTLHAPIVVSRDLLDQAGQSQSEKWIVHGHTGIRGRDEDVDVMACRER